MMIIVIIEKGEAHLLKMIEFYNKLFRIFSSLNSISSKKTRVNFGDSYNCMSLVFLCGGNLHDKYTSRNKLRRIIKKDKKNKIIISEKLDNLSCGLDLLSFERVLESISKAVVIPIESMGTACELGAFTYGTSNLKEIVIVNKKYNKPDSFIIGGPVALINKSAKEQVLYADYSGDDKDLFINNGIRNINNLKLMKEGIKLHKYYDSKNKDLLFIKDLGTFLFCILDLCNFIGYCNSKIAIKYFCMLHNKKRIVLNCDGFNKDEKNVIKVVDSFFSIMGRLKILRKVNDFWLPNFSSTFERNEIGSLLFNKSFLKSYYYSRFYFSFRNLLKIL